MKKTIARLLTALIVFSIFLSFGAKTAEAADKLDVKISVGYNENYKIGYSTPVNITVKNNYKDIDGEVEIRVPSTPGKYMSYVRPISLQKDAEKVITINVPVNQNRTKYTLNIYNGRDKIYEDSISTTAANNVTAFVGMLSDDFAGLSYINQVPAGAGGAMVPKVISLDEKNFPDDIFTLSAFDIIIINDYDTSRLSGLQYEVLKQWVSQGGTLLLGTGAKYGKTLSVFKDDFIVGAQGSIKSIATSKIYELATNGENKNEARVDALPMDIKDSRVLMEDKGVVLVQALNKGKGVVGITAFDLGQAPFVNWINGTAFAEKLLELVNSGLTADKNISAGYDYIRNNSYMLSNAINQFSELATAKTSNFYLILLLYVIIVAPLSYFILKKIDKRELMWITVPVFAVIFAVAVYISGSGTRLGEITTNMVSFLNIDEKGNATSTTYAGIFNANKMKITVKGKNGEKLIPVSDSNYSPINQPAGNEVMEAKVFADSQGGIEYRNSSLLETRLVQIQEEAKNVGRVEMNLSFKNGALTGTIKNSTNLDLVDCLIVGPEGYNKIDSLKKGETYNFNGSTMKSYGGGALQQLIQDEFFMYNSRNSNINENERKSRMDKNLEGNILQMMFNYGNQQLEGINFLGFSKTELHDTLVINGNEVKKNERSVLFFPINLVFENGDSIEYPLGFVPYEVSNIINLNYDMYSKRLYGNGSVEILYRIDQKMKVNEIELNSTNMNVKSLPSSPAISIYNTAENAYEVLNSTKVSGDDLKKYLAQDNTVKIKLELRDTDIAIPLMAAKGAKK